MPGGRRRAWSALLDRYKNLIYSIPLRYGAPHQDAADIFQAVCLDLFNELPRLRDAEALQGWLIRVTTNKCYHWKRRQVNQESDLRRRRTGDSLSAVRRHPARRAGRGGAGADGARSDRQLPPRCREMIELLFFEHRRCRTTKWRGASTWRPARSGSSAAAA